MRNLTCVLHHHVGVEGMFEEGLGLTSSREEFLRHLRWFEKRYNFVSLEQVLSGDLPRSPLLLTFDDAWKSVLEVARELLAPRGIPSVYFINPGMVEKGAISLDSILAWAVNSVGIERVCQILDQPKRESVHALIVNDMAQLGSTSRQETIANIEAQLGMPDLSERAPLLNADDLKELVSLGVEIGNHTKTHVHCRSLFETELTDRDRSTPGLKEAQSQRHLGKLKSPPCLVSSP